ncbi:MAG: hypothetical protein JWR18_1944 [Segetibacter sp.]|jgi:hypothetical protein|nr:hypothetical protein [Segetibacter sp.]
MRSIRIIITIMVVLAWSGCKERFDARLSPSQTNFLVVEGVINASGITTINLSRTVPLSDSSRIKRELNAQVTIAGQDNSVFPVRAKGNGVYASDALNLNANQKYRLQIKTSSGGDYLSEYLAVKQTPPIDSVSWKQKNLGVDISVNTHDNRNSTRYYKWEYQETWEIHSAYLNSYQYANGVVTLRPFGESTKLYYCWLYQNSNSILVGTSAHLANDVISFAPLQQIPLISEKLKVRYSILVQQYAIDEKAYNFYKMMKSNTETLGSIFDPQPSEVTGNIFSVNNPKEKVVGFVSVATMEQKRIFIENSQLSGVFYRDFCESTLVPNNRDSIKYYYEYAGLLPYAAEQTGFTIVGYHSSIPTCVDCRLRGSNVKPSYW